MAQHKQTRPDAKLAHLPAEIREDLYLRLTEPQDDRIGGDYPHGRPWTLDEARDWLLRTHRVACSLSTISDFRSREANFRALREANDAVRSLQTEWIEGGMLSAEDAMEAANLIFIDQATKAGDVKSYKAICDIMLRNSAARRDLAKLRAADKTKIEAGLDALFAEIKGNARAEALFAELRDAVAVAAEPEREAKR